MEMPAYDDVTVSIFKRNTGEIICPTIYSVCNISGDKSGNVFLDLFDRDLEKHVYLTLSRSEVQNFITSIKNGLSGSPESMIMNDWFVVYFPKNADRAEEDVWMCKLCRVLVEDKKVLLLLNWVYEKMNSTEANNDITSFASSDVIKKLELVFEEIRERQDDDTQGIILDLSEKTRLKFMNLEREFSREVAAIEILGYKKFGKFIMRKLAENDPHDIILDTGIENVGKIIAGLENFI